MHNRIGFNKLGRKASHRRALHKNMVTSLFKHERIKTTKAKAKEIRRTAEKMITRAKIDSVHNRRIVAKMITDKAVLAKLFTEIGPANKERKGGYTRMFKMGFRQGDAAEVVLLELVEKFGDDTKESAKEKTPAKKKATPKKSTPSKDSAPKAKKETAPKAKKEAKPEADKKEEAVKEK